MHLNDEQAVTAAGVAVGAIVAVKYGGALPAIGPLQGPVGLIALGAAVALFYKGSGTVGEFVHGAALGTIAVGVVGLAG